MKVGILTVSDSRSEGKAEDTATPLLKGQLQQEGYEVLTASAPDEQERIVAGLTRLADEDSVDIILTTGGTGFGPRDVTPEATLAVVQRCVPGLPEAMRLVSAEQNPRAWLSRAVSGIRGHTLIVNLPGSPKGAQECLAIILALLPHAQAMIAGGSHGCSAADRTRP